MNLTDLTTQIQQTSQAMQQGAMVAVNTNLTIGNWLIGFYIVEFEQKGEDRANYGEKLLQNLADRLNEEGFAFRNLYLFRSFFLTYTQLADFIREYLQLPVYENNVILQSVTAKLKNMKSEILHTVSAELTNGNSVILQSAIAELSNVTSSIGQTVSAQLGIIPSEKLIRKLSFTHFTLLLPIDNPIKRQFYELECIKGTWSVWELNRQIKTLYYERSGLSNLPEKLSTEVQLKAEKETLFSAIKSPFTFEFLGLKSKDVVYESYFNSFI